MGLIKKLIETNNHIIVVLPNTTKIYNKTTKEITEINGEFDDIDVQETNTYTVIAAKKEDKTFVSFIPKEPKEKPMIPTIWKHTKFDKKLIEWIKANKGRKITRRELLEFLKSIGKDHHMIGPLCQWNKIRKVSENEFEILG